MCQWLHCPNHDQHDPFTPIAMNTGNKYILVITEYLTRWCEAIVLSDAMVSSVAHALLQRVIFPHGCPRQLLDQGSQFHIKVICILSHSLGIAQIFTSSYHLHSNGLTEHLNQTIKQVISTYVDPLHQSWDQVLPFVVHAYNTSVQESTRISPFRALYGHDPRLPSDIHSIKTQPPTWMQPNGSCTSRRISHYCDAQSNTTYTWPNNDKKTFWRFSHVTQTINRRFTVEYTTQFARQDFSNHSCIDG